MAYNLRSHPIPEILLQENDDDGGFDDENSESEVDNLSEHSESEFEVSDEKESDEEGENATLAKRLNESRARGRPASELRGKNNYTLNTRASERASGQLSDAINDQITPSPANAATDLNTIEEMWDILFPESIIKLIVEYTNRKVEDIFAALIAKEKNLQSYHYHTDVPEIKAFIVILYYSGLWKASKVNNVQLWSKSNGISFYRSVMPLRRFLFLSTSLRFDDKSTRDRSDKFGAIREIWDIFIANCGLYYTPTRDCTVDEQLLSFRGRCSFRIYIKSKPDKYGLKIMSLNDANTGYMIFAVPYLGKESTRHVSKGKIPEYFLQKTSAPIHNTNRTVTCDNWFTTIPIMESMLKEPYKTPITGTIKKNKREIPPEMKVASKDPPDSKFCFSRDVTLVSHTPKKNRIVLVASTFLKTSAVGEDGKPELIRCYNKTKGGTDLFDKLCHAFSVTRRTNRWPVRIFFGMLDQAIVNSRILLKCKFLNNVSIMIRRYCDTPQYCLERIYLHLAKDDFQERLTIMSLQKDLKFGILSILGLDRQQAERSRDPIELKTKCRCSLCPRKMDKKTLVGCSSCLRPMCRDHRSSLCTDCAPLF